MENEEKRPKRPRIGQPRPGYTPGEGSPARFEKVNYGDSNAPAEEGGNQDHQMQGDRPYQPRRQQGGYQPRPYNNHQNDYQPMNDGDQANGAGEQGQDRKSVV